MKICLREAAVIVAAVSLAVGLAACGTVGGPGGNASGGDDFKIGLLFPDNQVTRYEQFDRPLVESKIKELCADCTVEHANAQADVATQQQQVASMIAKKVRVLILDAVDTKAVRSAVEEADQAGIPVVAYDRLAEGPISAYVSFDPEQVGRLQGEGLLTALGDRAGGGQIVMMNGDPRDRAAALFKKGALSVLQGRVKIGKAYDTPGWRPEIANANMSRAITTLGADRIDGVYAVNDGMASGVIAALKSAKVTSLPPVTGQDAELVAVQRIVVGDQYMSVYKPFKSEATAAAEMAVALGRGGSLDHIAKDRISTPTTKAVPAVVLTPLSVTVNNIKDTVVKDGMYTLDQICTPAFASACKKAGLTP
ncbi:substrate-binding domain-containing protein [Streptomyces nigrescens]|uniref:substrate-binding domain-containing protein n=1 Tax=Streptomyces nigrescens TaxID=1920 RepID=UPI0036FEE849